MKRVKNKRYEKRISIICFILFVLIIIIMAYMQEIKAAQIVAYKNYTVKNDDTLWSIACKLDLNENIQQTIYEIRKDNNNLDPIIYPGQIIKIREVK